MKKSEKKIAVVGGDVRMLYLAEKFAICGQKVSVFGFDIDKNFSKENFHECLSLSDALEDAFLAVFPLPFTRDKIALNAPLSSTKILLSDIYPLCEKIPHISLGSVYDDVKNSFSECCEITDFGKCEEFAIKNALATAEGALAIMIREMPTTLHSSCVALCGYGRIGKILTRMLLKLGARVKVFARKESDRAFAFCDGAEVFKISDIADNLSDADVLINTVPFPIIGEKELKNFEKNKIIIELASAPGGIDKFSASKKNLHFINAQSLPGKYSPKSAGETIYESISHILAEKGVII